MNLEKEIPEYAMVPAKEIEKNTIEPITSDAIYSPVQITNVAEGQQFSFVIEEDILVPDIKPDLKEIILMNGNCNLSAREINNHTKEDEYVNLSGELHIETLYVPEKTNPQCPIISVETKIPFKEQFHFKASAVIILSCSIDKIEYMIINERKYRAKATITVHTKDYTSTSFNIFEGIKNEELHVLHENIEFSTVALRKKDILSIKEYISPIDDTMPGNILMKNIHVIENYKQLTGDKLVLNGFICLNILYCEKSPISDSSSASNIHQLQQKVEFTQFIPIQHISEISDCDVTFDKSQLKLKICQHEDGQEIFILEGDLTTYVELYRKTQREIIVDAYHNEKNFTCQYNEISTNTLIGSCVSESSVREIFVPENISADIDSILFTTGQIIESSSKFEQGKILSEGIILAKIICQLCDEEKSIVTLKEQLPFRIVSSISNISGDEILQHEAFLKDFWSEKINGKQLEFNATVMIQITAIQPATFVLITNPAFEVSSIQQNTSPMVIYCCNDQDSLWQIAKRFKTGKDSIIEINKLEDEQLCEGQKLLIMR